MEVVLARYESPDGLLRLILVEGDDKEQMLGFEGFPWHTHPAMQAALYGLPENEAVARFIEDLLSNNTVIAVLRRHGEIVYLGIEDDPEIEISYGDNETLELRYWDGSHYVGNHSGAGCS